MKKHLSARTLPELLVWVALLSAILLVAACYPPSEPVSDQAAAEVADEADMSEDEAAALAAASEGERAVEEAADEAEKAAEEAADEAEKAAEEAADEAEKAVEEAADAFEKALRNFEDLDAGASEAEVEEAFTEFEAASEDLLAAAAAAGADVDGLEQALDELEQQVRDAMASGEPLEFQKEFLSTWFEAFMP